VYSILSTYNIILASKSPRRKHLLEELGIQFIIKDSNFDEDSISGKTPIETVELLAQGKANALLSNQLENELVIAADTIVVLNNEIIGKPKDTDDAKKMLQKLSGNKHTVITGVCLQSKNKTDVFSTNTHVFFNELNADEINYYVDTFKPLDKAGAYGIQEWLGIIAVNKIEGSYHNVMGLPTQDLYLHLNSF